MSRHKTRLSLYAYGVILIGVRPEDDALSLVSPTLPLLDLQHRMSSAMQRN